MLTRWADTWHKLIWLHVARCVSVWMCMCLHACKCMRDRECVDLHTIACCLLSTARHSVFSPYLWVGNFPRTGKKKTSPFCPSSLELYIYNTFNTICSAKTLNRNNIIELRSKASSLCPSKWHDWGGRKGSKHRNREKSKSSILN